MPWGQHPNFSVGVMKSYAGAWLWNLAFALALLQLQTVASGLLGPTYPPRNSTSQVTAFSVTKVLTLDSHLRKTIFV